MDSSPHVDLLSQVPFLRSASADELKQLAINSLIRNYSPWESVTRQDEYGHSMFILVSGQISLEAIRSDGTKIALGGLTQPGDFFGEEALLGRGVRLASASAVVDTVLLEIEQRKFALMARRSDGARDSLERTYHQRAITTLVRMHPYLCDLTADQVQSLLQGANMATFQKDDFPFRQDDPAQTVILIADGVLKAVRETSDGGLSVLAYFNSGEIVGAHDPPRRPYHLTALGKAELIYFTKAAFDALEFSAPAVYARFGKDRMSRAGLLEAAGKTIFGSAEALFQEGMEVQSLLIIDLDRCVRCGNCVRACHSRHEYTRLDRRGPIFRRRKAVDSKEREHLLIPSSCRHCRDPECMIGCPTGAIERHPNGEVEINDNCIGCDNCARKCPYGNITMRPIPESEQRKGVIKQAIKCNLCRGHAYANCVHECPRGALLRVNPLEHFDELALVLALDQDQENGRTQQPGATPTSKGATRPKAALLFWTLFLIFATAGISTAFFLGPKPHSASSPFGLAFGAGSTACLFLALMQGARKKLRNHGLGRLESWTQFHMVIGALGFLAALAHSGFAISGAGTTFLLLLFAMEVATGALGQTLYSRVPKLLTHLEQHGNSKLIEDLYQERRELTEGIAELLRKQPPAFRNYASTLKRLAGSKRRRFRKGFDTKGHLQGILAALKLPPALHGQEVVAARLLSDYSILADTRAQIQLHRSLAQWLFVHLTIAAALVVFVVAHIALMLPIVW
jgi:Fe-S-cluster-containing dehydrogenase component/CRP-like cAMP-binding protein